MNILTIILIIGVLSLHTSEIIDSLNEKDTHTLWPFNVVGALFIFIGINFGIFGILTHI